MSNETTSVERVIEELSRMVMGPDPQPKSVQIDLSANPILLPKKGPYTDLDGNEILRTERPTNIYGVGVLFPDPDTSVGKDDEQEAADPEPETSEDADIEADNDAEERQTELLRRPEDDPDELPVPTISSKTYRPRNMGLSFMCTPEDADTLRISVTGGRYEYFSLPPERVRLPEDEPTKKTTRLYRHFKVTGVADVRVADFPKTSPAAINPTIEFPEPLRLKLEVFVRPRGPGGFLITVTLINEGKGMNNDQNCFFQTRIACRFMKGEGVFPAISPYPESAFSDKSEEDSTMDLLYREAPSFGTGHGCAADWEKSDDVAARATEVRAEPMPVYWSESITADIPGYAPTMKSLASDSWFEPISSLVNAYDNHVTSLDVASVPTEYRRAAGRHKAQAEQVVRRMKQGLAKLRTDERAIDAFRLANETMRLQQIASRLDQRKFVAFRKETGEPLFDTPWQSTRDLIPTHEPSWRAFQIGFLLTNIISITEKESEDREIVDLIWFPTGGGKTEAYLGLIAFAVFYERLCEPTSPRRVQVLMRYTMRLLTAQQFQRAASLVCAMEVLRQRRSLGEALTLGIWVGNAMTPNTRQDAKQCVADLRAGRNPFQSLFLHSQCPWCGAEVGTAKELPRTGDRRVNRKVLGIADDEDSTFHCSDPLCAFYKTPLPFHVVDQILLDKLPVILIATVDKFALLPKKPELRRFFAIGSDGKQFADPPSLIIQDELHLISEALGSMVGAYEALIHTLCERNGCKPKIVCSTATIRTYRSQIKALFARKTVCVFPPPEFSIGKSFFARTALDEAGKMAKRKAYLGLFGSGYLSFQTAEAITLASLLQAPMILPDGASSRDPYWTLLCFFSTLRELGTTLTLMHSAVRNRIRNVAYWRGLDAREEQRLLHRVEELTSRANSHELTRILSNLGSPQSSGKAIDACLATSIVEVGIDVPRLSLLCVVGQPKKTSTFVQATGRVGRKHPALVVTLYDHTRARDRSVYESFRAFHERMYASVEPTSLTPFAAPVQHRALAAVLAGYARLTTPTSGLAQNPSAVAPGVLTRLREELPGPFTDDTDEAAVGTFIERLVEWVEQADPQERERLLVSLEERIREWRDWQRQRWHCWNFHFNPAVDNPMMLDIDPMADEATRGARWYVPNSMRDVDSEAQLWVYPGADLAMIPGENDELYPPAVPN